MNKKLVIVPALHLALVLTILFLGSYAVARDAYGQEAAALSNIGQVSSAPHELKWYQKAAMWVCPFH